MIATVDTLRKWIADKPENATHMFVLYDTFSYEDYPVYIIEGQDLKETEEERVSQPHTEIMEIYSFALNIEEQLKEYRAFHR